ncbi:MAG: hypothetical protein KatS3mg110_4105 [Pirellulaceae bacterium]|nr:MAG: hypothetical protein KatS3mg110_4105 [Pirellulaceae bacterium]
MWKLEYATLALWAARWVDKLDRELHNEVTTGAMTSSNDNAVNVRKRKPWLPQAMKLKAQNPNLSDREVAKLVGVHPSTLSKCDSWRMARRKIETCNAKIHRGYVAVDGVDRTVDGIIENDDDDDNEENQFDVR